MYPHHLHTPGTVHCGITAVLSPGFQLLEIILLRTEIVHDIQADFSTLERTRKLESPILPSEDTDDYLLTRRIDDAVNSAVARLQAYLLLPSPFVSRIATDHARRWEEQSILLSLPDNWPPHLAGTLRDAVHNYVVKAAESAMLTVALPNDPYTALCLQEAERAYNDINSHVSARRGPVTPHPTIFG